MAKVCKSKLLMDHNIDGHALCFYWDWCHGRGECPCLEVGSKTHASIENHLNSLPYSHPTIAEVLAND